ncbi:MULTISPECIES: pentapeptide repeat-containing protein [Streptomyces]|uniref:pentapeptide repeat-containing protein n=1 Tax=Streptomyces TaxID=1883 RepID=UPI000493C576|nr:pentapeptide repeat-containing protein [Streptomyces sp. TOR3209]UAX58480.1 pentapeptide repeat-containing protein [Streptomyces sp. A144]
MRANQRPRSSGDRELRLWKVGWALAVTFVLALLAAGGIFYALVHLLDFQEIDSTAKLDAKTLFDLLKLSFGVVAGAGALVALVVAYRRQRVDEAGAHREATRLHTERFAQAVEQLGSDSPAIRLGGVYALTGLADDAPTRELRQTCIDVLCAYLRLPSSPDPGDVIDLLADGTSPSAEQREAHQDKRDRYRALREVRHTILRLIAEHYSVPMGKYGSWRGCNLDLTRVSIDCDMTFFGAGFHGRVFFDGATFSEGKVKFDYASFSRSVVSFRDAVFSGGSATFDGALFYGGSVHFDGAEFSGSRVSFDGADFAESRVPFDRAKFSGGRVSFDGAKFSGGRVSFDRAEVSGGSLSLERAAFSGGEVSFDRAAFSSGSVSFSGATGSIPSGLLAAVDGATTAVTLSALWPVRQ